MTCTLCSGSRLCNLEVIFQVPDILTVKKAVQESARLYAKLHKMGFPIQYIDVGGGLGIDYDGSQTDFESSVNYTLQEYANDVVYHIQNICDEADVPHPTIISESGRAISAYHSVLVFNVLGVSGFGDGEALPEMPDDVEQPLIDLQETLKGLSNKNLLETFHDASEYKDETLTLFSLGHLSLEQRVMAENLYWSCCQKILRIARESNEMNEELEALAEVRPDGVWPLESTGSSAEALGDGQTFVAPDGVGGTRVLRVHVPGLVAHTACSRCTPRRAGPT